MPIASMSASRTSTSVSFGMISAVCLGWYSLVSAPAQYENGSYWGSMRPLTSSWHAGVNTWAWMSTVRPDMGSSRSGRVGSGRVGGSRSGDGGVHVGRPGQVGLRVLGRADVAGARVALEQLDPGRAAAQLAESGAGRPVGDLLVGHRPQVLPDPETAGVPRGPARGQDVVGADDLVPVGDAGPLPQEQGAVVAHPVQSAAGLLGEDLPVLAGEL